MEVGTISGINDLEAIRDRLNRWRVVAAAVRQAGHASLAADRAVAFQSIRRASGEYAPMDCGNSKPKAASVGGLFHRAERNAMASTTSHPVMTSAATAPAVILAFSLVV
jgi:hypothetical protein